MTTPHSILIRAATAADQRTIIAMVRAERLNPLHLDWPRFIVAEARGQVVGIGQIKVLGDGTRELASLVTAPTHQGLGIGSALVHTLQSTATSPLYLRCATHNVTFYERFGFVDLAPGAMPPDLRRAFLLVQRAVRVVRWVKPGQETMHVMGWWGDGVKSRRCLDSPLASPPTLCCGGPRLYLRLFPGEVSRACNNPARTSTAL